VTDDAGVVDPLPAVDIVVEEAAVDVVVVDDIALAVATNTARAIKTTTVNFILSV